MISPETTPTRSSRLLKPLGEEDTFTPEQVSWTIRNVTVGSVLRFQWREVDQEEREWSTWEGEVVRTIPVVQVKYHRHCPYIGRKFTHTFPPIAFPSKVEIHSLEVEMKTRPPVRQTTPKERRVAERMSLARGDSEDTSESEDTESEAGVPPVPVGTPNIASVTRHLEFMQQQRMEDRQADELRFREMEKRFAEMLAQLQKSAERAPLTTRATRHRESPPESTQHKDETTSTEEESEPDEQELFHMAMGPRSIRNVMEPTRWPYAIQSAPGNIPTALAKLESFCMVSTAPAAERPMLAVRIGELEKMMTNTLLNPGLLRDVLWVSQARTHILELHFCRQRQHGTSEENVAVQRMQAEADDLPDFITTVMNKAAGAAKIESALRLHAPGLPQASHAIGGKGKYHGKGKGKGKASN